MLTHKLRRLRRGTSAVQWMVFAAVITLVVVGSVRFLGQETEERMDNASTGVGDPSELVQMMD